MSQIILKLSSISKIRISDILFFIMTSISISGFSAENDVLYIDSPESRILTQERTQLRGGANDLNIADAWWKYSQQEIVEHDNSIDSESRISSDWFAFTAKSSIEEDVWINLNNSNLDSIHFFQLNNDGEILDIHITGSAYDKGTRLYNCATYWFPLIRAGDTSTYHFLIKVYTSKIFEVPIEVGSFGALTETRMANESYTSLFVGSLLAMLLFNIAMFFFIKDRVYLYYLLYTAWVIVCATFVNNYPIVEYILGRSFAHLYIITWMSPIFVLIGSFTISYLDLKSSFPKLRVLLGLQIIGILLLAILNVFLPLETLSHFFLFLASSIILSCLGISLFVWLKGESKARFYVFGWSILVLSIIIHVLVLHGVIPYTPFNRNILYFGIAGEILIFSISLAERINRMVITEQLLNINLAEANKKLKKSNDAINAYNNHVGKDIKNLLIESNKMAHDIQQSVIVGDNVAIRFKASDLQKLTKNGIDSLKNFLSFGGKSEVRKSDEESIDLEIEINKMLKINNLEALIKIDIVENDMKYMIFNKKAFESVFVNFFKNTIAFNENLPHAKIRFLREFDQQIIIYEDNGIGIDLNAHGDGLFKPFVVIENGLNKSGQGLGLYLVNQIILNYGGDIKIESELGKGIQIKFNIPLYH